MHICIETVPAMEETHHADTAVMYNCSFLTHNTVVKGVSESIRMAYDKMFDSEVVCGLHIIALIIIPLSYI